MGERPLHWTIGLLRNGISNCWTFSNFIHCSILKKEFCLPSKFINVVSVHLEQDCVLVTSSFMGVFVMFW